MMQRKIKYDIQKGENLKLPPKSEPEPRFASFKDLKAWLDSK